jgi:hypothetical protein
MMALATYLLLAAITVAYVLLVRSIWSRSGDVSIIIGSSIVYAWTFLGAWFFIPDAAIGFKGYRIGLSYYYLMEKMFPFMLDRGYVIQLVAYACFVLALFGVLRVPLPSSKGAERAPVQLSREWLVAAGIAALAVSVWSIRPLMGQAMLEHRPLYLLVHEWNGMRHSLHAFSASAACFAFVLGSSVRLAEGGKGAPFTERGSWLPGWSYLAGVLLMCVFLSLTGDRHTIFGSLMLGGMYLINVKGRAAWRTALWMLVVGGGAMVAGGSLREMAWTTSGLVVEAPRHEEFHLPEIQHIPRHPSSLIGKVGERMLSNEMFCAHFSLYGIMLRHVKPVPGISFNYLLHGFLPADRRPPTAYDHYAGAAGLVPDQGYTIHHASAWYLNAGWAGIPIGGAVLGLIWVLLMRTASAFGAWGWPRLLPWLFVAFLPAVIRSGPESYKALVIEGLLLPLLTLAPSMLFGGQVHHPGPTGRSPLHA